MLVLVQMNRFYWITDEENSCYPNSRLLSNIWYRSIFSLYMHHSPKYISFILPGGWEIFLLNSDKVRFGMASQNSLFQFWSIFQQLLLGISALRVWRILSSFLCLFRYVHCSTLIKFFSAVSYPLIKFITQLGQGGQME